MLYYLFEIFGKDLSFLRVFSYITFRAGFALITAILISILFGKRFIKKLLEMKMGQPIREDHFHSLNQDKKNTPTMGGILIAFSVTVSTLLWGNFHSRYTWLALFCFLSFAVVGFADDYFKLKYRNSKGLSGKMKLVYQFAISFIIAILLFKGGMLAAKLWGVNNFDIHRYSYKQLLTLEYTAKVTVPFLKNVFVNLGWMWIPFVMLVIVGSSNAVNLTDGLDGLAAGSVQFTLVTFTILCYISGHWGICKYLQILYIEGIGEVTVFGAAMIGGVMGFLWFNCYPAQVFMGDIGSLAIGAVIGFISVITKSELLLLICGAIFVAEALSVMMQVTYFKYTKKKYGEGRRIFKMAPLHHHFEMMGLKESKVIVRFWIISIILMLLTLGTLKLR